MRDAGGAEKDSELFLCNRQGNVQVANDHLGGSVSDCPAGELLPLEVVAKGQRGSLRAKGLFDNASPSVFQPGGGRIYNCIYYYE